MATSSIPATNVVTVDRENVARFDVPDLQHSATGKLIIHRLKHKKDCKILITGDVGDGKTALGVCLARWVRATANDIFDRWEPWDVDEHAGMDVWEYLEAYRDANPGDCLLLDELYEEADKRRAMANTAVFLSWAWMKLRVRQVVSIGILPTTSVLDGRLEELADVWVHVERRGEAHPYYLKTSKFPPYKVWRYRMKIADGFNEVIRWPDLDGDPDFERLAEMKEESGIPGIDRDDHFSASDVKERERQLKKKVAERGIKYLENGGIRTQKDLGAILGIEQATVSKYKRKMETPE